LHTYTHKQKKKKKPKTLRGQDWHRDSPTVRLGSSLSGLSAIPRLFLAWSESSSRSPSGRPSGQASGQPSQRPLDDRLVPYRRAAFSPRAVPCGALRSVRCGAAALPTTPIVPIAIATASRKPRLPLHHVASVTANGARAGRHDKFTFSVFVITSRRDFLP